jgi:pimeloyl-ACP methyl ester carboxylesterase/mannose-6-phosphate isomerase-like protein (cupin superfamily)
MKPIQASEIKSHDLKDTSPNLARGGQMFTLVTPGTVGSRHHILGRALLKAGERIDAHIHDYSEESLLVISGRGELRSNGGVHDLIPGRAVLVPRGTPHEVFNTGNNPLEIVFAASPLAPKPQAGHRTLDGQQAHGAVKNGKDTCDYVEVAEGVQMFYRTMGEPNANPPVLLLHGNRDNHTHFTELQHLLSDSFQVIAVDFRGHGLSSKPDCTLTTDLFVEDLEAFINHCGWKRVILIGHSLGAVVSMQFALRHPEKIYRLVLMGAAAHYEMKWKRPPVTEETYPEVILESNRRAGPFFFLDDYPAVKRRVIASWSSVVFTVHRNLIQLTHPDLRSRLLELRPPALVMVGEEDKSTPIASATWIAEHVPNGRLVILPRTGHFLFMEQPETVASHIREFISTTL